MSSGGGASYLIAIIVVFIGLVVVSMIFKALGKILGAISTIAGVSGIAYGMVRANSAESQFIRAFGGTDEEMLAAFILGGIAVVLGIILFVVGMSNNKVAVVHSHAPVPNSKPIDGVKVRCPKCQALNEESAKFCVNCGETLIVNNLS